MQPFKIINHHKTAAYRQMFYLKQIKMTVEVLKNWNKMKGHLKREFPMLNNNDVTQRTGKDEEMMQNILFKTGKTEAEMTMFLNDVLAK
jgi:hypothetical protein